MKKGLLLFSLLFVFVLNAQSKSDVELLEELTNFVCKGINSKKHDMVLNAFIHPSALIYFTSGGVSNVTYSKELNTAQGLADFARDFKKPVKQTFDYVKVNKISEGRATVSTYYYVTIDGQKSHKGHEFYSAIKTIKGWKFVSIMFTMQAWTDN